MGSTYLGRPCKPWPRFDRDTWRVNESPREAREHFASRLKAWVRFRPRMFWFFFITGTGEYFFPCSTLGNPFDTRVRTHLDLLSISGL